MGGDFVSIANLGPAQIYPSRSAEFVSGVRFEDPTGPALDGGLEVPLSRRFSLVADARYKPIETQARATFPGTSSTAKMSVKPIVVSTGIAFHF